MNVIDKNLEILERMDKMIRRGGTGNADEFAMRLNIGKTCFFEKLKILKDMGADASYNYYSKTYEYKEATPILNFKIGKLSKEYLSKLLKSYEDDK